MVYRKHYRNVSKVPDHQLRKFIVEHLSKCTANEQSISYMIRCIRDEGMYMPTRLNEAEDAFERLGFTFRRETNEYGAILRSYVVEKVDA